MASLKEFIANSKSFVSGITGKALWSDAPAMTLEQVTARIKAILGKDDQFADPDIDLTDTSSQIAAIIGLTGDDSTPEITLHGAKTHVDTSIATPGTAHGITGFGASAAALAATQSAGTATTVSRGDHVHAIPFGITGFGASAAALAATQSAGTATTVSRGDHEHAIPFGITGFATSAAALGTSAAGTSAKVSRGDHVHAMPTAANVGAAPTSHTHSDYTTTHSGTAPFVITGITIVNGIVTDVDTDTLTRADIGAAALAGSSSQQFSVSNLLTNDYNGIKHASYTGRVVPWDGRVDIVGSLNVAGNLNIGQSGTSYTVYVNGSLVAGSDLTLKRAVRPMQIGTGMDRIRSLASTHGVIHFNWIDDVPDAFERTGFSAQAIRDAMPEASRVIPHPYDKEALPTLGWDIGAMLAMLVDAVATLDARLDALESARGAHPPA